jgi:hypothetical protein
LCQTRILQVLSRILRKCRPGNSGFRPGYSGFGNPDAPDISPDIPGYAELWALGYSVNSNYDRLGLISKFQIILHTFSYHCIRVAAAAEGAVYEVVAEPQEPQGQAPQEEVRRESAQGPTHPNVEQQTQGKPWCTSYYFKL